MWDRYLENSLKQGTREARGTGTRRRVCDNAAIPLNLKSFLRLDDNKKEAMLSEEQFRVLERFVVIMYNRTTPHQDVHKARLSMFSQGTRRIESIPPTQAAIAQHVRRAAYQAGHVRGRTLDPIQNFQVQQNGDGIYLQMDGHGPRQPYLKHQKRAMSSSNAVASVHVADSANTPRQTCPALRCAPAMAIAIKSEKTYVRFYPFDSSFPNKLHFVDSKNVRLHRPYRRCGL